jgi:hypothetical protein
MVDERESTPREPEADPVDTPKEASPEHVPDATPEPEGTPAVAPTSGDAPGEPREVKVPPADEKKADWRHDLRWASALLLFAILGLAGWNNTAWQVRPEGRENLGEIVQLLLGEQQLVFLLQLLAILLVVALIGAVVLAIRDPESDELPRGGG